jgi:tight adherence protein B
MNAAELDMQLADLIWCIATALRSGYNLDQIFEQLASIAPEPTASGCEHVRDDILRGVSCNQALDNWQETISSAHLGKLVSTIQKQQESGGNLAVMLDPVGEAILAATGSDGAFFPAMNELARNVGARVPSRALTS